MVPGLRLDKVAVSVVLPEPVAVGFEPATVETVPPVQLVSEVVE